MLVAYGPGGRPVIAEEIPLEQLQQWSHERALYCPNCRGTVHVRGGQRMQLHFAHMRGECAWSTEGESVRHMRGKIVLAQWLHEQFPQASVSLEQRLPEPNRIADIFVKHTDGQCWAVEFQCAPLELSEWQHRHEAYRKSDIFDIWIIGSNRREKEEAFLEAVIAMAHEILFLDPLLTPPRIWLRWPVTRDEVRHWQRGTNWALSLGGWVGRMGYGGYGATLDGQLQDVRLENQGQLVHLVHPARSTMNAHAKLLRSMEHASSFDEATLLAYLQQRIEEEALRVVVKPLIRAYLRDPDLLRRYNYGRGLGDQPLSEADMQRVRKARAWLLSLAQQGFSIAKLQELAKEIPFVGPYTAFAHYMEMLVTVL
jgi:hypothetical protein